MGTSIQHRRGTLRPKSLILIHLWVNEQWALQYDWLQAWGHELDLTATPLYTAWRQLKEILKNRDTSHSFAALAGQSYLPGTAETIIFALNQSGRKLKQKPPWQQPDQFTQAGRVHGKARETNQERRRQLNEKLGITTE